jgi:hypothetical protein
LQEHQYIQRVLAGSTNIHDLVSSSVTCMLDMNTLHGFIHDTPQSVAISYVDVFTLLFCYERHHIALEDAGRLSACCSGPVSFQVINLAFLFLQSSFDSIAFCLHCVFIGALVRWRAQRGCVYESELVRTSHVLDNMERIALGQVLPSNLAG